MLHKISALTEFKAISFEEIKKEAALVVASFFIGKTCHW